MIALCLGALVGVVLALTGAGGGILAVPALTLGLGFSMTQASPVALLTVASAAAMGMMGGLRKGYVRYRAALLISATGITAAPFGQRLAHVLPERWLIGLFACVMLVVAARLFLTASHRASGGVAATISRSNGHGEQPPLIMKLAMPVFPHPNPDGTTDRTTQFWLRAKAQAIIDSHSTSPTNNAGQVAGYPPGGEGTNERWREFHVKTCVINTQTGRIDWSVKSFLKLGLIGVLSGMATGLLGVGGGFIIVPALLRCSNISMNGIIATSLMVIALIATGAVISDMSAGHLQLSESALLFIVAAAGGMLLGRQFAEKIPPARLQQGLSVLIACVASALLFRIAS